MVCRKPADQSGLLRVTRVDSGLIVVANSTRRPTGARGRSVYVCRTEDHIRGLFEKGRIERALRHPLTEADKTALCEALICKLR